jgi:hypothetical protein
MTRLNASFYGAPAINMGPEMCQGIFIQSKFMEKMHTVYGIGVSQGLSRCIGCSIQYGREQEMRQSEVGHVTSQHPENGAPAQTSLK